MSAKHTPGPWHVVIDDDGNPLSGRPSVSASNDMDCTIVHWDGFVQKYWRSARGDNEIHANARLIAAAPDLLALLQETLTPGAYGVGSTLALRIEAAIAKATGGAA